MEWLAWNGYLQDDDGLEASTASIGQFGISFGVSTTRLVVWVRLLICIQFLDDVIIQFITHCVQTLLQQDVAAHFLSISSQQTRIVLNDSTLSSISVQHGTCLSVLHRYLVNDK